MSSAPEFAEAGQFLRRKRKENGLKTQKNLIQALKAIDPDVSCSETYISLIEKGVKSPGVHLLDMMAQVLRLSAAEKTELLLTYKRVPSDLEFAVRDNLKIAAQESRLDRLRLRYQSLPSRSHFDNLLQALVMEGETEEALGLLKQAPTFENEVLELQERTAKIALISGQDDFARHAFQLALENCKTDAERAHNLMHLGILAFQAGLRVQYKDLPAALEAYLEAFDWFEQSLALDPHNIFCIDEHTRCAYHLGDALLNLLRLQPRFKPTSQQERLKKIWLPGLKKSSDMDLMQAKMRRFFEVALHGYEQVLSQAHRHPLPDKPMQEAVFFYAYVHGKLKLFSQARVLIHSNLLLQPNWLTWFMKAGLCLMEYDAAPEAQLILDAEAALVKAMDFDPDAVKELIRLERNRELRTLWLLQPENMEALLNREN